jgi:hypothetical protein
MPLFTICRGRLSLAGAVALLFLATGSAARAGEDHFLVMFGSQRIPNEPNYAHTFATFVRVSWPGDVPCPAAPTLEAHTISWLPNNGIVRTLALHPECGRNFGLHESIRFAQCNNMRTSVWGAYRIAPELYRRAVNQVNLLQSGRVLYKANDAGQRDNEVSNCIHAVATISEGYRLVVASPGWGELASYFVLLELESMIVQPGCTHPWIGSALGLDQYPLIYRDYRRPTTGALGGPVYRLFGGERSLQATYGPPQR